VQNVLKIANEYCEVNMVCGIMVSSTQCVVHFGWKPPLEGWVRYTNEVSKEYRRVIEVWRSYTLIRDSNNQYWRRWFCARA
jgi:hypothetical protein